MEDEREEREPEEHGREAKSRRLTSRGGAAARAVAEWGTSCESQALIDVLLASVSRARNTMGASRLEAARRSSEELLKCLQDFPECSLGAGDDLTGQHSGSEAWAHVTTIWMSWVFWLTAADDDNTGLEVACNIDGADGEVAASSGCEDEILLVAREEPRTDDEKSVERAAKVARTTEVSLEGLEGDADKRSLNACRPSEEIEARSCPVLLKCIAFLREVLRAVVDASIPSEVGRALFDAGAPLEVLQAEVLPDLRWDAIVADAEKLPRCVDLLQLLIPQKAADLSSEPCSMTRLPTVEELAEAVAVEARCSRTPLMTLLAEALVSLVSGLRRLTRNLNTEVDSSVAMLTGTSPSSSSRATKRVDDDSKAPCATAVRLTLIDACSDRRIRYLHDIMTSVLKDLPQPASSREGIPAAVEAKWVSKKLQSLRRLQNAWKLQTAAWDANSQSETSWGGMLGMQWLCTCLTRPTTSFEQILLQICIEGTWALLLPSALVIGPSDFVDTDGSREDFYLAALRKANEMATHAISLGRKPVFPESLGAQGSQHLVAAVRTAICASSEQDQSSALWLSELELFVMRLCATQLPRSNLLSEINHALLTEVALCLQPPTTLEYALDKSATDVICIVKALSPVLKALATSLGPDPLVGVLATACQCLRPSTLAQPFATLALLGHGCLRALLALLHLLNSILIPKDADDDPVPLDSDGTIGRKLPWQSGHLGQWPWRGFSRDYLSAEELGPPWPLVESPANQATNTPLPTQFPIQCDASSGEESRDVSAYALLDDAWRFCDPNILPALAFAKPMADKTLTSSTGTAPPPPPGQPPPITEDSVVRRSNSGSAMLRALASGALAVPSSPESKPLPGTSASAALCTYVKTGSNFVEQHWYYCYTCGFSNEKGMCSVCAQTCHAGHQVVYSRKSRFFCDCGASGCCVSSQKAVSHRSMKGYTSWAIAQPQQLIEQPCDPCNTESREESEHNVPAVAVGSRNSLPVVAQGLAKDLADALLILLQPMLAYLRLCQPAGLHVDAAQRLMDIGEYIPEIIPWASFPKGSFECQLRGEWHTGGGRQLGRAVAEAHGLCRRPVAFLSRAKLIVTEKDRVRLVELKEDVSSPTSAGNIVDASSVERAEGNTDEAIPKRRRLFDDAPAVPRVASPVVASAGRFGIQEAPVTRQPGAQRPGEVTKLESCRFSVPFEPLAVAANEHFPGLFAVTSLEECHLCVPGRATGNDAVAFANMNAVSNAGSECGSSSGVIHRMALELMLEAHGEAIYVLKVCWLPASQTELAIITNHFVKIYDLAIDRICPQRYVQILNGVIADCAFEIRRTCEQEEASKGVCSDLAVTHRLWVLSGTPPMLYHRDFGGRVPDGPAVLQKRAALPLPHAMSPRSGLSLVFSQRLHALVASFDDGLLVMGTPRDDGEFQHFHILETSTPINAAVRSPSSIERGPSVERPAAYSQILEWEHAPGFFVGWSRRSNVVHVIHIASRSVESTPSFSILSVTAPAGSPRGTFEGIALWSQNSESARLATLMEDGSLHLYSLRCLSTSTAVPVASCSWPGGLLALDVPSSDKYPNTPSHSLMLPRSMRNPQHLPEFPIDFFEHADNLTADPATSKDVSFGGDATHHFSVEIIRQRLSTQNEETLQCDEPENAEGFTLEVRINSKRRWAPIGIRLLLGHTQRSAGGGQGPGPSGMKFVEGNRRVTFWDSETLPNTPTGRRWFDVPFAPWETHACLGQMPVVMTFVFSSSGGFVIDALELYSVPFASFPRQHEAPCLRGSQHENFDFSGVVLMRPAAKLAHDWLGGMVRAIAEPMVVAKELAVSALSCYAALQGDSDSNLGHLPTEVYLAAQLWQDFSVATQGLRTIAEIFPGRPDEVVAIELQLAADKFLERFNNSPSDAGSSSLMMPLAAFASEWCRHVGRSSEQGEEVPCQQLLRKRPGCAEALGSAVRAVVIQQRDICVCPEALLGSLVTAAVTAASLQLSVHLEDCFCSRQGVPEDAEISLQATEDLWMALCASEENDPHFETIAFLLTHPMARLRDFALRSVVGLTSLQICSADADTRGSDEVANAVDVEGKATPPSSCADGSDVEDDDIPMVVVANSAIEVPAIATQQNPRDMLEVASPEGGAELLPLLLLSYLTTCLFPDKEGWSALHRGSLASSAGLFEASQRLVLVCLEAEAFRRPGSRFSLLFKTVFSERASTLASVVQRIVQPKFPPLRDAAGRPVRMPDAQQPSSSPMQGDEGDAATHCSEDFLCGCVSVLGALLTALMRAHESVVHITGQTFAVIGEVLDDFASIVADAILPLFAVVRRNIDVLVPRDSHSGFLAVGGTPPPKFEEGLLKVPCETPASHFYGFLPAAWLEACDAEACHALERPAELLTMSTLSLLMAVMRLAQLDCRSSSGHPASVKLATFVGVLKKADSHPDASNESCANVCSEVITQLVRVCGGLCAADRSSSPSPIPGVLAFGARGLLYEMCGCSKFPFHRLLDTTLYASIQEDLRTHMALDLPLSGVATNTQSIVFVEACRSLWATASARPWTWVHFISKQPEFLEYCLAMGRSLGARYGCSPLRLEEVAECATLAFRLVALALAPVPNSQPRVRLLSKSAGDWFRWIIEACLCSASYNLRQTVALALALVFDDLQRQAEREREEKLSAAVVEVKGVVRRGVEALLVPLGSRASEFITLASYILAAEARIAGVLPKGSAEVAGSVARQLCHLHISRSVPLLMPHDASSVTWSQRVVNIDEMFARVAALTAATQNALDGESEGVESLDMLASAATSALAPVPLARRSQQQSVAATSGAALAIAASPLPAAAQRPRIMPCGMCAELVLPLKPVRLESLRADLKFSDEKMWVRFGEAMSVSTLGVVVHEHLLRQGSGGRHVGHMKVYFNDVHVQDVATLKAQSDKQGWQKLCILYFEPAREGLLGSTKSVAAEVSATLPTPVTCCNLLFEYFESVGGPFGCPALQEGGRLLVCPRCHRPAGKSGICHQCGDNAFQCPKCRNINYEKLDALFCNDCGYCRFLKMETWLTCRPTHEKHVAPLGGETECRQASKTLEELVGQCHANPTVASAAGGGNTSSGSTVPVAPSTPGVGVAIPAGLWRQSGARDVERPLATAVKRESRPEDSLLRSMCSISDLRQKILQHRRNHQNAAPYTSDAASSCETSAPATLPGAKCEACMLTVLLSVLKLLTKLLEACGQVDANIAKGVVAAVVDACIPYGLLLIEDMLLPLALRCSLAQVRSAARNLLLALVAVSPKMEQALCLDLGRSISESCLGSTSMTLRTTPEQAREETLLLLKLVLDGSRSRHWLARLPLLANALADSLSSKHPLAIAQVALPCMLLALRSAQELQETSGTATPSPEAKLKLVHLYALIFPDFLGPVPGRRGGEERANILAVRVLSRWRACVHRSNSKERFKSAYHHPTRELLVPDWLVQALTHAAAPEVQPLAADILRMALAERSSCLPESTSEDEHGKQAQEITKGSTALRILDHLRASVFEARPRPKCEAALKFVLSLLSEPHHWTRRTYCVATGWMPLLRGLILDECAALVPLTGLDDVGFWSDSTMFPSWLVVHHQNPMQAESLVGALKLLNVLLADPLLAPRRRKEGFEFAECILTSLLLVRSVRQSHLLQSAHLSEASSLLDKALQQLQGDQSATEVLDFGAERKFLTACIRTLRSEGLARKMKLLGLPLSVATKFTFEQIAGLLCPEPKERSVLLHLQKASSQEEYIRGQMRKNPYVSLEIGPTMRHIREKISSDLNIRDAMEIMELLVGDKIIGLDLPIAEVHDKVWVPFVVNRRERLAEQAAAERGEERADAAIDPQQQATWDMPPMTVIFRLSGLDGEATEDMVETLPDVATEAEEAQAQRRKELCKTFCTIGGMSAVVEHLEAIVAERGQDSSLEVLDVLLWIALEVGEVEAARCEFLDLGGLRALLAHLLRTIDEMCARKTVDQLGSLEARVAERLLSMIETLARERGAFEQQCVQPLRTADSVASEYSATDHVSLLLSLLCQTEAGSTSSQTPSSAAPRSPTRTPPQWVQKMRTQVACLLPFLTFGQPAPAEVLVRASTPLPLPGTKATVGIAPSSEGVAREALSLDLVTSMVEHVPSDLAIGGAVRAAFFRAGAVGELLQYLEQILPQEPCEKSSPKWVAACQAPGLPAALRILAGLTANFREAQHLVADRNKGRLLKVLLRLEGTAVSSMQQSAKSTGETCVSKQVGACAEGLLEALKQGNEDLGEKINHLRRLQRNAKSSRATQSRQKILKNLGMASLLETGEASDTLSTTGTQEETRQDAQLPTRTVTEELMKFEDIHEDLRCCVCQEGYHFQPEELLCIYTYVKPMAINASSISVEDGALEGGPLRYNVAPRFGLCSVSHFTAIHWHCHQSATKAAANLRPKAQGEWESATVRNSSSKCNALIPVFGPSLPEANTTQAIERHFGHLGQVAKGNSSSVLSRRAACTFHDLRLCFTRLACQETFSSDTGGGGPRHNMCLAVIMLQLLSHDALSAELSQELGDLERLCIEPLLDFRGPEEASEVVARYRVKGQPSGPHPGHLWALCTFATFFRAGTPGGGSTLEWSAGTLWRLLALALEISRQSGPMKWDQRPQNSPGGIGSPRPGTPPSGGTGITPSPGRTPPQQSPRSTPRMSVDGGSAHSRRANRSTLLPEMDLPGLELEPQALIHTSVEEAPESIAREAELELLADAVPMLRFLAICDVFRWRLERWSRGEGGAEDSGGRGSDSVDLPSSLSDDNLGTPLLSRPALRRRLRRFDGPLLEVGEAVAHLFSSLSTPSVLWRFFLYRLGDQDTPEFNIKLPPHSGTVDPLELLRPPRLKADPSLPDLALLPRFVLKSASAREAVGQASGA